MSLVLHDVPPYMIVEGRPTRPRCSNVVGLKRHDFPADDIKVLGEAFKLLYRQRVRRDDAKDIVLNSGPIRPVIKHLFH